MMEARRPWTTRVLVFCHVVILVAAVALVGVMGPAPESTAEPVNCAAGEDIGIAGGAELMSLSDDDLDRELSFMRAAGVRWLRVGADWAVVEGTRGQENWGQTDRVVDFALARGFRLLGIVLSTPQWARPADASGETFALPADVKEFGRFAGDAAARYAGRIGAWEIWNEPNNPIFAKPRPDVAVYASMIEAASAQIRARAPGAQIITAGLAPAGDDGLSIAPTTFVDQLYNVADKGSWDAVGIHPYTYPALPDDPDTGDWNTFQRIEIIRNTMVDNGDGGKKIWITEFGAPTGGAPDQAVSEDAQATAISQGIDRMRGASYFGPLFIHQSRDRGADPNDVEDHFGLLRLDFSEKPAYAVVSAMSGKC
ncbi:glycosyl hydrolase [Mycolicibacterium komossense]|uniref:Beta-xylosidase n=1 Tax=Mycolicibacterium komossense TaxID=1779 RepID=A0ABT3CCH8_9MYCO|nr:glycosyl hydrolase [Mycolicibacterium komossense]MCV7227164.1 beta-xylosidase [Mycolicibacterium komossense]